MTSIFFGQLVSDGVPASEEVVRNTATPVEHDAPAAVQDDMPEPGEVETDPNPDLGMVNRQLASAWTEGQHTTHQPGVVAMQTASEQIINDQVATSGLAASREASGQTRKTLAYAVGIEPVNDLVDGHKLTNNYFVRNERNVQDTMVPSMTVPPGMGNPGILENIAAAGARDARDASQSSVYNNFWNGGAQ